MDIFSSYFDEFPQRLFQLALSFLLVFLAIQIGKRLGDRSILRKEKKHALEDDFDHRAKHES